MSDNLIKKMGASFTWGIVEINVGVPDGVKNFAEAKRVLWDAGYEITRYYRNKRITLKQYHIYIQPRRVN